MAAVAVTRRLSAMRRVRTALPAPQERAIPDLATALRDGMPVGTLLTPKSWSPFASGGLSDFRLDHRQLSYPVIDVGVGVLEGCLAASAYGVGYRPVDPRQIGAELFVSVVADRDDELVATTQDVLDADRDCTLEIEPGAGGRPLRHAGAPAGPGGFRRRRPGSC